MTAGKYDFQIMADTLAEVRADQQKIAEALAEAETRLQDNTDFQIWQQLLQERTALNKQESAVKADLADLLVRIHKTIGYVRFPGVGKIVQRKVTEYDPEKAVRWCIEEKHEKLLKIASEKDFAAVARTLGPVGLLTEKTEPQAQIDSVLNLDESHETPYE